MKITLPVVISLVTSVTLAAPRATDEGDPAPQTSRVTAYVVDKDGNPSVECWEFSNMINSQEIQRHDGSTARLHSLTLTAASELEGLDILTWPPYSPIWPPPRDAVHAEWSNLAKSPSLFGVQSGLIQLKPVPGTGGINIQEDYSDYTYQLENGDDWFYFEDNYTYSDDDDWVFDDDAPPSPIQINTISGRNTEVLRFRFPDRPEYKVVHKGACNFSGIKVPTESKGRSYRSRNPLVKQQYRKEAL